MRVITTNVNGIRSAHRKGFFDWLNTQNSDVICLQELRADEMELQKFILKDYHSYFCCAEKKGYSGVGIFSRHKPKKIIKNLGWSHADTEGRYVAIDLEKTWVASLYMPSGTSGDARQAIKYDFLDRYFEHLNQIKMANQQYIICGDLNIAHKQIDIKNWRGNQKNSGFLPQERAWLDKVFDELGFVDAFRVLNDQPDQYTWWSNRGQAYAKNVGWRIDYQVISPELKERIKYVHIYKDQKFSDHAPLIIDYDIIL